MRKHLVAGVLAMALPGSAFAADIPVKAPPPAPAVIYSWSGCYVGFNVGGFWGHGDGWTDTTFGAAWGDGNGNGRFMGGGQAGCNYQFDRIVIGGEWDVDWTARHDITVVNAVPGGGTIGFSTAQGSGWISTLAARFGVAFDRVLVYGKAGVGWVGASGDIAIENVRTGALLVFPGVGETRAGLVVGAGLEWAFWENWSMKLEYDYLARTGDSFVVPAGAAFLAGDTFSTGNRNIQMVKFGVNWRFNWGAPTPVRAAY